ncbi:hypothetical protein GT755_12225 [Herbidospora sp. NEAU-GS84]|uniref:Uncharacterized protein n=1 Tax=Herbidospora solisilvae TaxID=2696284 RepID=A0A7C9J8E3_9ACTN|nr:hypothetical protein [Herbidospora solisilvae]NAS22448.1 hypothetical protein [Herbidospora solisilvae]
MRRNKPLQPGKPLARRAPMKRGNTELKRVPLKSVSDKRRAENRRRRAMKDELWPDGIRPRCVVPWCGRLADDLHEPLTRARGGPIDDPDNAEPCCRQHNEELTREPAWGYDLDLLIHEWDKRTLTQQAADRRAKLADWPARTRGEAA